MSELPCRMNINAPNEDSLFQRKVLEWVPGLQPPPRAPSPGKSAGAAVPLGLSPGNTSPCRPGPREPPPLQVWRAGPAWHRRWDSHTKDTSPGPQQHLCPRGPGTPWGPCCDIQGGLEASLTQSSCLEIPTGQAPHPFGPGHVLRPEGARPGSSWLGAQRGRQGLGHGGAPGPTGQCCVASRCRCAVASPGL